MNYGFLVDNSKCIGCHACSTACKSENDVPLGVHRTWVKYVERGIYPDVQRSFQVTRCNHCANPPCVRICPVTAMYQRDDGIVEFDADQCIGCKGCMQACPYDAIHIDPDTGTASKCHYCAHRVDVGLEPACVVVCPVHAIVAGDMDDPASEISQVITHKHTTVRKPEQGTAPKLHYVEGNDVAMVPTALGGKPAGMMWSDVVTEQGAPASNLVQLTTTARSGATIRKPTTQGVPPGGPIRIGQGTSAEHMVQVAWNAQHKVPWHWPVPAYLVTKGIGAGAFMFYALGMLLGLFKWNTETFLAGGLLGLVATVVTTIFLVIDLERPERFLRIILRPQWSSWLTRGAFLLIGFSTVAGLWWAWEAAHWLGFLPELGVMRTAFAWATVPLGVGAAVYTAFLFAQAEGRDLWQSPLLPIHLLVQAAMLGAASFVLLSPLVGGAELVSVATTTMLVALALDLFVTLFGEFGVPHPSDVAARAAHEISHGKYAMQFWGGSIIGGHVVPFALLFLGMPIVAAVAAVLTFIGLYFYEHAFVMAPQEVPNS
jgi:Fe-S-cluster-containing dehydrogenase component/formate-dependent nitrite reductase membrane component NrfD